MYVVCGIRVRGVEMGQNESLNSLPNAVELLPNTLLRQAKNLSEISSLTYEEFLDNLSELNTLSRKCMDASGKQLVFVVKKGSDSSIFWKGTVKIVCLKYHPESKTMENCRFLNLVQFMKIFKTIKNELSTAQQIDANEEAAGSPVDTFMQKVTIAVNKENKNDGSPVECCICLERRQEIILPCAHSYCQQCIDRWNVNNNTCPVCREVMTSRDEEWILSDAPNSAEINEHIASSLIDIAID